MQFEEEFKKLNAAQQQAVNAIEGPVLVVAGPGTGKTQLLSMRAANIVRRTDTLPSNILCLTFTESAALAMRKRLIALMGPEGNKVAVHTFHSFGTEVINQNPEHFYNGARFLPADELTSYEILYDIFNDLPHSNPLAKTMNGEFTALRDAQMAISHLKRAGLLPDELLAVLDHNQTFCDALEPQLTAVFDGRFSKKDFPKFVKVGDQLAKFTPAPLQIEFIKPLATLCSTTFSAAVAEAQATGKTTPLTAWRNKWLEKSHLAQFVFKDRARAKKLRALAKIYQTYRKKLAERALYDFDDMVSLVAHTCHTTPELRFSLQEQYLYIMVDEFQDTNGAQLRLLSALTDNPVNEGRPNVLAVGDDDQAIYAFQGAELSNILDFAARYRDTLVVTLTDNYRSTAQVLQHSRAIITQGGERLETALQNVNKQLTAHHSAPSDIAMHQFATPEAEYAWVADELHRRITAGQNAADLAVLARHHKQLVALLPYLHAKGLLVNYERRNNVLESPHVRELITLAEVMVAITDQRFDVAESLLPELLSYEFWGLKTADLWQLSLRAYQQRRMWLELMLEGDGLLHQIAEFLIVTAHRSLHEPLDVMLDMLIGSDEQQVANDEIGEPAPTVPPPAEEFTSPFRAHYFTKTRLQQAPAEYLMLLSNLRALRQALHNYRPDEQVSLRSFVDFIDLHERTNTAIVDTAQTVDAPASITLMTAHKAKGLEFQTVIVLSCQDEVWGRRARHPSSSLSFPFNLPIEPAGQHYDDALRLFFVAMTRAKQHLLLTAHTHNSSGKEVLPAEFLAQTDIPTIAHQGKAAALAQLTPGWERHYLHLPHADQATLLQPLLQNYRLSATHINNFTDVTRGGPQAFLLDNLLRFPQAMTHQQIFGHAIHAVLQRAHTHLTATGERRPLEDILHDFELQLQQAPLGERDFTYLLGKGSDVLTTYLGARHDSFTPDQKAERSFAGQQITIGDVRLTGIVDVLNITSKTKTITVTDYKTGKALGNWHPSSDYDKLKLHKYKQQLMFYKLLVENSSEFAKYTVNQGVLEFVESDADGNVHQLSLAFNADDLAAFITLIKAVWQRIMQLDFPDVTAYDQTLAGVLTFEDDLRRGVK